MYRSKTKHSMDNLKIWVWVSYAVFLYHEDLADEIGSILLDEIDYILGIFINNAKNNLEAKK